MNSPSQPFNVAIAPAPVSTVSPDRTVIDINNLAVQIKDNSGATWAFMSVTSGGVPGQIGLARNGTRVFGNITTATIKAGTVYVNDPLPPVGSGTGWMVNVSGTTNFNASGAPF